MDPAEQRQAEIDVRRTQLVRDYPFLWHKLIKDWKADGNEDRVWLTYSASYLFRTGSVRWAIDPYTLHARLPAAAAVDTARDLQGVDFILLTHRHADHLDRETIYTLREQPIRWVVPSFMLATLTEIGIPRANMIIPQVLQEIELDGIHILPFEGLHFKLEADGEIHGVPEMGYCIDVGGQRWVFPGDTREFDSSRLPQFGQVDIVFAHLWLGRREALKENPSLLQEFCHFYLDFHPRRIIVTHLEEVGRNAKSFWNLNHFQLVAHRFKQLDPAVGVDYGLIGQSLLLSDNP